MLVSKLRRLSTPWSALEITILYKKRFIHFFNSSRFFTYGSGNGINSYRPAFEFVNDAGKNAVVHFIESMSVYIKSGKCMMRNIEINGSRTFHLCKVAHTAKKRIGNTRSSAAAAAYFIGGC